MINYSDVISVLEKDGKIIAKELNGYDAHLIHMAIGVISEAGKLLDAVKKSVVYHKPLDMKNILEELGDIEFYMEGLRQGVCITRDECLEVYIAKLGKRYEGDLH